MGRVALLFGSILLYSVANIANGMVHSLEAYAVWRFIAGVGLAGELGGSITLVSEVLSKELRGYGTMLVATVGVSGAVVGGIVATHVEWRTAYFIGGGLGLALLFLRMSVAESGMFQQMKIKASGVTRGNFLALFTNWKRFNKYLRCILIGMPSWFVVGVLVMLSPEFAKALNIQGVIKAPYAVSVVYLGITCGDLVSGLLSQWLRTRIKIVFAFILFTTASIAAIFSWPGKARRSFIPSSFFSALASDIGRCSRRLRRNSSAQICARPWPPPCRTSCAARWCRSRWHLAIVKNL